MASKAMTNRMRALAYRRAALHDGPTVTAKARATWWQKLLDTVDPDHVLPDAERERRAKLLRRAHMIEMSVKAAAGRRKARAAPVDEEAG